jgi:hypothetical protein
MKALLCGLCFDIRALDPNSQWVVCRCGNMAARWEDPLSGKVLVRAKNKDRARMLGLNNRFLEPGALVEAHEADCSFWKNLHSAATNAPGFLFDQKFRGCWAAIYSVGETGDTRWDPGAEDTLPPPSLEPTERPPPASEPVPAPPTDSSLHKLATVKGGAPAPGYERAEAPQPIDPATGQNKDHWVLPEEERAKGYIRPIRRGTTHQKCGATTYMPVACAETYARDPKFYAKTFCCTCVDYFPVGPHGEFVWEGTNEKVGT